MKREIAFFNDRRHKSLNARDLIATLRMLGMSDEQIKVEMLRLKVSRTKPNTSTQSMVGNKSNV